MGQSASSDRSLYADIIKHTLRKKGVKVSKKQLSEFLQFIRTISPWFPEEGTLDLHTWDQVGNDMKRWYRSNGRVGMPSSAYAIWNVLRQALDVGPEAYPAPSTLPTGHTPFLDPEEGGLGLGYGSKESVCPEENVKCCKTDQEDLTKEEEDLLKPETFRSGVRDCEKGQMAELHDNRSPVVNEKPSRYSAKPCEPFPARPDPAKIGFRGAMQQAHKEGDFFCFPVIYEWDEPEWEPLPYKLIKELKHAVSDYGPNSPYTMTMVEGLAAKWMTPYDWFQVAKACLTGGNFLLWKMEYEELAKTEVKSQGSVRRGKPPFTLDMLLGQGTHLCVSEQLTLPKETLQLISSLAIGAWKRLPSPDQKSLSFTNVKQKPEEPFADFVARLTEAVSRTVINNTATDLIVKQLAFENATPTCQTLIQPVRRTGNLSDYIRACAEITPSYIQGLTIAAALQGQTATQILKNIRSNQRNRKRNNCYSCGGVGHFSHSCPARNSSQNFKQEKTYRDSPKPNLNIPRTVCPRCEKGFHWQKACQSKFHKNGTVLLPRGRSKLSNQHVQGQMQGNVRQAQTQVHKNMKTCINIGSKAYKTKLMAATLSTELKQNRCKCHNCGKLGHRWKDCRKSNTQKSGEQVMGSLKACGSRRTLKHPARFAGFQTIAIQKQMNAKSFNCGKLSHLPKQCEAASLLAQKYGTNTAKDHCPKICPKFHRGVPWAKICKSKIDGQHLWSGYLTQAVPIEE